MSEILCAANHRQTDTTCSRPLDHSGVCWGPWVRGVMTRSAYLTRATFAKDGDHRGYEERFIGKDRAHA